MRVCYTVPVAEPVPTSKRKMPARLGRYEILAPIASGGMAAVYLGRHRSTGGFERLVAIKVLHAHLAETSGFVAMFLDEARIAARIRHPNVVDVFDVESVDGELIIAMQYVEGASLRGLVMGTRQAGKAFPRPILFPLIHDVLSGLHAAHELTDDAGELVGLVHRDVSPHNILVGVDGVARVADFGVAKARGRLATTRSGNVKGKLRYLAPEQLLGEAIDRRVDVFALGVVLWECLTLRPLFKGSHEAESMMAILQKTIQPPSRHAADVSEALDRICLRALERDREKRYPTALAFAKDLEEVVGTTLAKRREIGEFVLAADRDRIQTLREAALGSGVVVPEPRLDSGPSSASPDADGDERVVTSSAILQTRSSAASTTPLYARPRPRWPRWTGAVALVTALAIGGYFLVRGSEAPPAPEPEASTSPLEAQSKSVESSSPTSSAPSVAPAPAVSPRQSASAGAATPTRASRPPLRGVKPTAPATGKKGDPYIPGKL